MTQTYDFGGRETEFPGHVTQGLEPFIVESGPPPPRVRISLKRLASGEWQPDYSIESFDADPATDTGYSLIARRLEDIDSLVRQRIKQFTDRDARATVDTLDPGEEDLRD